MATSTIKDTTYKYAGYTDTTTGIRSYKVNGTVTVSFEYTGNNTFSGTGGTTVLYTLPEKFRPPMIVTFRERLNSNPFQINTDGQLVPMNDISNVKIRGQVTYVTKNKEY